MKAGESVVARASSARQRGCSTGVKHGGESAQSVRENSSCGGGGRGGGLGSRNRL